MWSCRHGSLPVSHATARGRFSLMYKPAHVNVPQDKLQGKRWLPTLPTLRKNEKRKKNENKNPQMLVLGRRCYKDGKVKKSLLTLRTLMTPALIKEGSFNNPRVVHLRACLEFLSACLKCGPELLASSILVTSYFFFN